MKEKKEIKAEIEIPDGIDAEVNGDMVNVKGKSGSIAKSMLNPNIKISKDGRKIVITSLKSTKRERRLTNTFRAHIKNMLKCANEGSKYTLKICSGHFPMNVSVKGSELIVKNFFGEKIPRTMKIKDGANVKVEGDVVYVESPNKELASQVAADIEALTKRTKYDTRIFQDGIWVINKDGRGVK